MATDFWKRNKKLILGVLLSLCIIAGTATGVYAYLMAATETLTNEFVPATLSCAVKEDVSDGIKQDIRVKNTGNIDAYIRAVVVVTFVSEEGKVSATAPKEDVDYDITWNNEGWAKGTDGYWYYRMSVRPEKETTPIIEVISELSSPDGFRLNVQVIASAIQSTPSTAIEDAWGIKPSNGLIIP